jgi:hypothetical protein
LAVQAKSLVLINKSITISHKMFPGPNFNDLVA